ncbi:MAG TPA: hypothetical protein VLE69_00620 [Candidatus Saccharimonadales bacterium]|nr:hypothetical protein [Candidatus Saccharimonadales bacterium]
MVQMEGEDFPSIAPHIVEFDDKNDTLSYVFDHSIGASTQELVIIDYDILDTYFGAVKLLRKERSLSKFIKTCGSISLHGAVDYDHPDYQTVRDYALTETGEDADEQLDTAIVRFANHQNAFDALYGSIFSRNKSAQPERKRKTSRRASVQDFAEELPDGSVVLKQRDIPELPGDLGLSLAAEFVLKKHLEAPGIKAEQFKKSRVLRGIYGPDGHNTFKRAFPALRDEIITALDAKGIVAEWDTVGKARGMRYVLTHQGVAEPLVQETPAEMPTTPTLSLAEQQALERAQARADRIERQRNERRAAIFTQRLVDFCIERIDRTSDSVLAGNALSRVIEETLGTTRDETRTLINGIWQRGHIFKAGNDEGMILFSSSPVEITKNKPRAKTETDDESETITSEDIELGQKILQELIGVGHQHKGLTVKSLCLRLGIEIEEGRKVVNKLAREGYLAREQGRERSRSPHSKKNKVATFIKFPSQEAWNDYKADPAVYLADLEESVS